jgi:hypothetical protein
MRRNQLRRFFICQIFGVAIPCQAGLSARPIEKTLADTMIITLAMANVLERYDVDASVNKVAEGHEQNDESTVERLKDHLIEQVGRMAKLSEGHDHMEVLSYRADYVDANSTIIHAVITYAGAHGINLLNLVHERWSFIRLNKVA